MAQSKIAAWGFLIAGTLFLIAGAITVVRGENGNYTLFVVAIACFVIAAGIAKKSGKDTQTPPAPNEEL